MSRAPRPPMIRVPGRNDHCACGALLVFDVERMSGTSITYCPRGCADSAEHSRGVDLAAFAPEVAHAPVRLRQRVAAILTPGAKEELLQERERPRSKAEAQQRDSRVGAVRRTPAPPPAPVAIAAARPAVVPIVTPVRTPAPAAPAAPAARRGTTCPHCGGALAFRRGPKPSRRLAAHSPLADARIAAGLGQAIVAARLGITKAAVAHWEAGRTGVSAENRTKLAALYGKSELELFGVQRARRSRSVAHTRKTA